jgi:hypothetical protein
MQCHTASHTKAQDAEFTIAFLKAVFDIEHKTREVRRFKYQFIVPFGKAMKRNIDGDYREQMTEPSFKN